MSSMVTTWIGFLFVVWHKMSFVELAAEVLDFEGYVLVAPEFCAKTKGSALLGTGIMPLFFLC